MAVFNSNVDWSEILSVLNPNINGHTPFTQSPYYYINGSNVIKPYFWGQYHNEVLHIYDNESRVFVKTLDANPLPNINWNKYYVTSSRSYRPYVPGSSWQLNKELYCKDSCIGFKKTGIFTPKDCQISIKNCKSYITWVWKKTKI